MLTIKEYAKAESLEQAYQWNQKKSNRLIGGMMWLRLGKGNVNKAIDISGLGLDTIEETEEEFSIGGMVTLRQLETNPGLHGYTKGAVKESLRHIVGVQFRNLATVGGSIYGRYGFSDVLTMFLAMDSYVELYKGGILPLEEYAVRKPDRDIIVRIIVKKKPLRMAYLSRRNTKTDFPVLTCAVSYVDGEWRAVVGARPQRAVVILDENHLLGKEPDQEEILKFAAYVSEKITTGSNMRGSAQYRKLLAETLVKRACMQTGGSDENTVHA
ncbi:MAG: FAD binding domain-containing protein [Clostridiales bacterium]|nr:FAD binding domain-containing protein [Clostridiales bacterium]